MPKGSAKLHFFIPLTGNHFFFMALIISQKTLSITTMAVFCRFFAGVKKSGLALRNGGAQVRLRDRSSHRPPHLVPAFAPPFTFIMPKDDD